MALILMPVSAAEAISDSPAGWGHIGISFARAENLITVEGWSAKDGTYQPTSEGWRGHEGHERHSGDGFALWYGGTPKLHDLGRHNSIRQIPTPVSVMEEETTGAWQHYKRATLIVTYCERDGKTEWAGWQKSAEDQLDFVALDLFEPDGDLLGPLEIAWPREELAEELITVVGLGSIGGAACEAMAAYGLRRFALVDHDRLLAHNFARHRSPRRHHGRYKVNSVADLMRERDPTVEIETVIGHIGFEADRIRPLLRESSIVACFADGPDARRTTAHLAFWARRPIVLACVLGFGSYGEILRLHPGRTGCFECNRDGFSDAWANERVLEVTGMEEKLNVGDRADQVAISSDWSHYQVELGDIRTTAVTGDLHLVGALAAKATVASTLSRSGMREQSLPGDHALVGLRPPLENDAAPFDQVNKVGKVAWLATPQPNNECPTCSLGAAP